MESLVNPHRGAGLPELRAAAGRYPSTDADAVARLLALCPAARTTPLLTNTGLAAELGIADLHLKDERRRMGLGSFKALGAAYVIARHAESARAETGADWSAALAGRTYVTASAGNHGLSVAAGARVFGAAALVLLPESAPEDFAARLRDKGATVERAGAVYEEAMAAAADAALSPGRVLLSDSSWPGYTELPWLVMEGYLQMIAEAGAALPSPPSHILLQAGVGGMAAAVAAYARKLWGETSRIVVVEPVFAPALYASIRSGRPEIVEGPVSAMGRLDCKTPSLLALAGLARDADLFVTIAEDDAARAVARLAAGGCDTTPSGAAGVAALLADREHRQQLGLDSGSHVLAFVTEAAETA